HVRHLGAAVHLLFAVRAVWRVAPPPPRPTDAPPGDRDAAGRVDRPGVHARQHGRRLSVVFPGALPARLPAGHPDFGPGRGVWAYLPDGGRERLAVRAALDVPLLSPPLHPG